MTNRSSISAILITFGLAVAVAGCGSAPVATPDVGAANAMVTATPTAAPTATPTAATTATAEHPATTPTTSGPSASTAPAGASEATHFLCPNGGLDEAAELQREVDQGHQPWRLSAKDVAAACTFGIPDSSVEALGADTYRVTQVGTSNAVVVEVTQPVRTGDGGIWVLTRKTPVS